MLNFFNNTFNDTREIKGFTRDELLEIKDSIEKFKSENVEELELKEYLKAKKIFIPHLLKEYSTYLDQASGLVIQYFIPSETSKLHYSTNFFYLKTEILEEVNAILMSLKNLYSNIQNVRRITKNTIFLDDISLILKNLLDKAKGLHLKIGSVIGKIKDQHHNDTYLWVELNKIKNLNFKLNNIPETLKTWNDVNELYIFIESLNEALLNKRKKEKKELPLTFHFEEIYQFFLTKGKERINFYSDLLYLLYLSGVFEIYQGEEFVNILERKEVIQNLKNFIRPLLIMITEEKLHDIFIEIDNFDIKEGVFNLNKLKEEKISVFLPKVVDYYIMGLEKKFQEKIQDINKSEDFEEIANFYYKKIEVFSLKIESIEDWVLYLENYLIPYENITESLKKILSNISSEIYRRKNEYLAFIKTLKDEETRVATRNFISGKISEANELIRIYEDEASIIIKEEFPQLKKIREMLNEYNSRINKIKDEVYKKLDSVKTHDIDIYQIIKLWEDNFNRKKQQLTFLISLLINKLFKNFKELLDKEGILFATITEITEQTESFKELPLNFALSSFLSEKLSEDELRERISEINSKINQLSNSLGLYQVEQSKLEKILENRVKARKGISDSDIQCTVCHKKINFIKDKVITCPFCASTYHYLCVAFWLSKYNSCPLCQNHFLEPHSELFESENQEF